MYLARDQVHGRPVALKVLHPDLTASVGAERFLREIRLTAQLHHPHIVPVLDSGEHDGLLFCVLPYMDGGTLRDRLDREKQLPIEEAVAIARTVGEALAYAHERGLIHRDVKPENILFSVGQPCLADFGIAKALEHVPGDSTSTGIVRGTPAYMSPEQAGGERNYDGRSDVYSLACVLYEMVAGMPAFIGPTTQSLLAQRMIHQPRELSVYRARVSPELEAVVEKALEPAPADRYAGAKEFVEALEAAPIEGGRTPTQQMRVSGVWRAQKRWRAVAITAATLLVGAVGAFLWRGRPAVTDAVPAEATDTTKVVLLPLDRSATTQARGPEDALLYQAFLGWQPTQPVDAFQVQDALLRHPDARTSDVAARDVVRALGAGRFIRGTLTSLGDSVKVTAALFDVRSRAPLYQTIAAFAVNQPGVDSVFAGLAKALLLRGRDDGSRVRPSSRSLPAVAAFADGMSAALSWDLERADSLFQAAISYDSAYTRAAFYLAKVRAWRERPASTWLSLARRSLDDSTQLFADERRTAAALEELGNGHFVGACREYATMAAANPHDFTALYGLGQCHGLDSVLVRDRASPFGWRYRSSYQQALIAYQRAFETMPSQLQRFQAGSFRQMRELLFTRSSKLKPAYAPSDTTHFLGRPAWRGDTLVMIPIPLALIRAGDARAAPAGIAAAVAHQREIFHRIAADWSAALPRSAGAKEALAVSLETLGDPAAEDTLRLARALSDDPQQRDRLAAAEAVVALKLAIPNRLTDVQRVRRLVDSLLAGGSGATGDRATALLPLAALAGRCELAATLSRRTATADPMLTGVTSDVVADAAVFTTLAGMGCKGSRAPSATDIFSRVPAGPQQGTMRYLLLARAMRASFDPAVVDLMSNVDNDYALRLNRAVLNGRMGTVRQGLDGIAKVRATVGWDGAYPDAVLAETRLLLAAGDSTAAANWLDRYLPRVRFFTPGVLTSDDVALAGLVRLMALRADLAAASRDTSLARRWAAPVVALWSGADAELQPVVRRLAKYVR